VFESKSNQINLNENCFFINLGQNEKHGLNLKLEVTHFFVKGNWLWREKKLKNLKEKSGSKSRGKIDKRKKICVSKPK
jgi:hypothetical protein